MADLLGGDRRLSLQTWSLARAGLKSRASKKSDFQAKVSAWESGGTRIARAIDTWNSIGKQVECRMSDQLREQSSLLQSTYRLAAKQR